MGVDNIREAVKAVLAGGPLVEVAKAYGHDKGALSRLVTGARIGLELAETASIDNGHGNCENCEQVHELTVQVEKHSNSAVDNSSVTEGIATDIMETHAESASLRQELEDLKLAVDVFQKLSEADLSSSQLREVLEFCSDNEVDLVDIVKRWIVYRAGIRCEREKYKRLHDRFENLKRAKNLPEFEIELPNGEFVKV